MKRFLKNSLIQLSLLGMMASVNLVSANNIELANTKAQLAIEYLKVGNLQSALLSANEATQAGSSSLAFLVKALVQMQLKMDVEADASFLRSISIDPANAEANNNYGWFLCSREKVKESIIYFDRALANPLYNSPQTAWLNKGVCLMKLGQLEAANESLLAGLRSDARSLAILKEMTRLQMSMKNLRLTQFYFDRFLSNGGVKVRSSEDILFQIQANKFLGRPTDRLVQDLQRSYPDSKETQLLIGGSR